MIVKDEECSLERCLQSVAGLVDEIIIVDTGSTDSTIEIAKRYGARVFHLPWPNDFAVARNYTLEKATREWILCLDADEELLINETEKFHHLLCDKEAEGYLFEVRSLVDTPAEREILRHWSLRLWRNRQAYRFSGPLHEELLSSISNETRKAVIKKAGFCIRHYGYTSEEKLRKKKAYRNIGILEEACRREPDNLYFHYNLGVEYWQLREFQKAAESFEEVWRNCPRNWLHLATLARNFTICLYELGRYNKALDILEQCTDWFPAYTDLFYLKGNIFFAQKLYEKAIQLFNHCLELGEAPDGYVSSEGVGSYRACFLAGNTFEKMGIGQEAVKAYTVALQCRPGHLPSLFGLVRILVNTRELDDSIDYLTSYFEFADALSLKTVMDAFAEAGAADGAVVLAQKVSAIDEKMQKSLLSRAFLLKEREILKLALQRFDKIPTLEERIQSVNLALEKLTLLHGINNLGGEKNVRPHN